ncbi:hypothetical protein GCM10020229_52070 [Kitasatospora albolonga]|uniref:hypothetical protein n=1 Tax=Kitasatospora albolonga TaxID=68173 RepID=UPI0031EB7819
MSVSRTSLRLAAVALGAGLGLAALSGLDSAARTSVAGNGAGWDAPKPVALAGNGAGWDAPIAVIPAAAPTATPNPSTNGAGWD